MHMAMHSHVSHKISIPHLPVPASVCPLMHASLLLISCHCHQKLKAAMRAKRSALPPTSSAPAASGRGSKHRRDQILKRSRRRNIYLARSQGCRYSRESRCRRPPHPYLVGSRGGGGQNKTGSRNQRRRPAVTETETQARALSSAMAVAASERADDAKRAIRDRCCALKLGITEAAPTS